MKTFDVWMREDTKLGPRFIAVSAWRTERAASLEVSRLRDEHNAHSGNTYARYYWYQSSDAPNPINPL